MFNNYQELFNAYADFYSKAFCDADICQDLASPAEVGMKAAGAAANQTVTSTSPGPNPSGARHVIPIDKYLTRKRDLQQQRQLQQVAPTTYLGSSGSSPAIGTQHFLEDGQPISVGSNDQARVDDFIYIGLIFIGLVVAKRLLTSLLRRSSLLARLGLREKDRERLDECSWRFVYYSFTSVWLIYTCFWKHQAQRLFDPSNTFHEYSFDQHWDEYWILVIECAFYLHGTYAILFEDVWRRDTPMMFIHHLAATYCCFTFSSTRTHRMALACIVLRDTCDVLLEATKLAMSFRIQNGQVVKSTEFPIKITFTIFTLSFVVNQLYYYPFYILYHFLNVAHIYNIRTATMIGINSCLIIFLCLDLVWFVLIIRLLYRMLFTSGSVDDLREYDADEVLELQRARQRRKSSRLLD